MAPSACPTSSANGRFRGSSGTREFGDGEFPDSK
jgi:hypothetical protein